MTSNYAFTYYWLRQRRTLVISCALVCLLIIDTVFRPTWVRVPFWEVDRLFLPIQFQIRHQVGKVYSFAEYWKTGVYRVADLERTVSELRAEVAEAEFLRTENAELKAQIEKMPTIVNGEWKVASVISESPVAGIMAGSREGISVGDLVFSQQTLLGRVASVTPYASQVHLLSDNQWPIIVKTQRGVSGILEKEGNQLVISELASDAPIDVNDVVVTQGKVDQALPPDLYVGRVTEIQSDPISQTKVAVITQDVELRKLSVVTVRVNR